MKYTYLLIVSIFLIFFYACSPSQDKTIRELRVNLSPNVLNLANEFDEIEFIPLETTDENIVRNVSKVVKMDSVYIVYSKSPDNCVAMHDSNGRLHHAVRKMGKGPGELVFTSSMFVDSCIHIYDRGKTAIQSYDIVGDHKSDYKNVNFFSNFVLYNNMLTLYDCSDRLSKFQNIPLNHKVNVFDIADKDHPKLVFSDIERHPHRQKYMRVSLSNNFFLSDNDLFYWTYPADTIFNLNMESLKMEPYTLIDLGSKKITEDLLDKSWKDVKGLVMETFKRKLYYLSDFYSLKKDIYCFRSRDIFIGIDHKKSDELNCYKKMQLFPLQSIPPISIDYNISLVGSISNNCIIFAWQASDFIDYCNKAKQMSSHDDWEKILSLYPGLEKTLNEVTEESNPVLMVTTLK
jgi:hypothetical protein